MSDIDVQRRLREIENMLDRLITREVLDAASSGISVVRSSGTALFGIDATSGGSALTITNNGTATPFGGTRNFSGLIIISETAVNGQAAVFLIDGGGTSVLVAQTGAAYSNTQGTAAKTNVYIPAGPGAVTIENKLGATASYNVLALRTRTI